MSISSHSSKACRLNYLNSHMLVTVHWKKLFCKGLNGFIMTMKHWDLQTKTCIKSVYFHGCSNLIHTFLLMLLVQYECDICEIMLSWCRAHRTRSEVLRERPAKKKTDLDAIFIVCKCVNLLFDML